jgi:hypothetical protein
MKKEIPPRAGLDCDAHLTIFSSTFLIPRFFENLMKRELISNEKIVLLISITLKKIISL